MSSTRPTKVGGIILDANQNLLLVFSKYSEMWGLPKGTLEEGETYLEGALREIKEETGLGLQPMKTNQLEFWMVNRARLYLLQVEEVRPPLKPTDQSEIGNAIWVNLKNKRQLQKIKEESNKMLLAVLKKLSYSLDFEF